MVAEQDDLLTLLDGHLNDSADGLHLRMRSDFVSQPPQRRQVVLHQRAAGLGQPRYVALQPLPHRVQMSPTDVEAGIVRRCRAGARAALCNAEGSIHAQHDLDLARTRRLYRYGPVGSLAEGILLSG